MTVKIITDSASDLPHEVAQQLGITVVSLNVRFGEEVYRNGIDLTSEEFYDKLAHGKDLPFSSVPTLGVYVEAYDKLAEETDEILVITLTSKLSATYEVALQATDQMTRKCQVKVIDSLTAVMAQGLIAIAAAKAAQAGASLNEVISQERRAPWCCPGFPRLTAESEPYYWNERWQGLSLCQAALSS
ncbi:Protein DegV [subsurface metagenome]